MNAVVNKVDDVNTPALTPRAIIIGVLWACFLAVANAIFSFRANYFTVPSTLALLLSYPMGIFFANFVPDLGVGLNPGPFSVKEHALICLILMHSNLKMSLLLLLAVFLMVLIM